MVIWLVLVLFIVVVVGTAIWYRARSGGPGAPPETHPPRPGPPPERDTSWDPRRHEQ